MSLAIIAKKAGVSVATVSRVMSGGGGPSKETISRVLKVVEAEGYRIPSPDRRRGPKVTPKSAGTGFVSLLLIGLRSELLAHPFFGPLVATLERSLGRAGLHLVITQSPNGEPVPAILSAQRIDGVLAIGYEPTPEIRARLRQLPTVWMLNSPDDAGEWADSVVMDETRAGVLAARYFLDRGLKDLAFLNVRPQHAAFAERGEAFVKTATAGGASVRMLIKEDAEGDPSDWTNEQLRQYTGEQLDRLARDVSGGSFPQGIFVPAEDAMSVLFAMLLARGIRPNQDVSLICIGAEERILGLLHPRPASIDLNRDAVARHAVELLIKRIEGSGDSVAVRIVVSPAMVPGEKDTASSGVANSVVLN